MKITTRLEELILLFLDAAGGWVTISHVVYRVAQASVLGKTESYAMATIIRAANKLLEMGLLEKRTQPSNEERRGRLPVSFRITAEGREALVRLRRGWDLAVSLGKELRDEQL